MNTQFEVKAHTAKYFYPRTRAEVRDLMLEMGTDLESAMDALKQGATLHLSARRYSEKMGHHYPYRAQIRMRDAHARSTLEYVRWYLEENRENLVFDGESKEIFDEVLGMVESSMNDGFGFE